MTDSGNSLGPSVRLSNAERDAAVARLNANQREGRLSESEFADRSVAVRAAVTRGDLDTIFGDLPGEAVDSAMPTGATATATAGGYPSGPAAPGAASKLIDDPGQPRSGRSTGTLAISLAPLVALVLFFLTGALFSWEYSWLWFILVPVVGVIVYGGGWSNRSKR